jgi:hypothetical protein
VHNTWVSEAQVTAMYYDAIAASDSSLQMLYRFNCAGSTSASPFDISNSATATSPSYPATAYGAPYYVAADPWAANISLSSTHGSFSMASSVFSTLTGTSGASAVRATQLDYVTRDTPTLLFTPALDTAAVQNVTVSVAQASVVSASVAVQVINVTLTRTRSSSTLLSALGQAAAVSAPFTIAAGSPADGALDRCAVRVR